MAQMLIGGEPVDSVSGETYEVRLNPQRVAAGVKAMLENPSLGHVVLAWRCSDHRVVGQLEVKKPFEVWYNAGYWYIDNHVVFEYDQREMVGTALLDYVSREAQNNEVERLRLYVGHMNEKAKGYYSKYGFKPIGDLFEFKVGEKA